MRSTLVVSFAFKADERLFLVFVNTLATALHAVGGQLSSDIDWCGGLEHGLHRDYMGMRCGEYKGSKIDSVAMMKTYVVAAAAAVDVAVDVAVAVLLL